MLKKILICHEDELTLRRLTKNAEDKNYIVTKCKSSYEFNDLLEQFNFDTVICSAFVQSESAIEMIKIYRFQYAEDKTTKFYILNFTDDIHAEDIENSGVDGLINDWNLSILSN